MERVTYKHYVQQVHDEFPDVDKKSIESIVRHGLAMLVTYRKNDHDILLNNNLEGLYYYFGEITNNEKKREAISRRKIRRKLRLVYLLARTEYSGYQYYGLTEDEYKLHLEGTPIPKIIFYKLEAEAKLYRKAKHFFKVKMEDTGKWCISKENYATKDSEYLQ